MSAEFKYDVFLSHSAKDKPIVRDLAERLKADGLRVWFDEWEVYFANAAHGRAERELRSVVCLCVRGRCISAWMPLSLQKDEGLYEC